MSLQKRKIDYKWVILIVCFLMEFICLGFCSSNPGLYKKAITDALGFDRTVFSITYSIRYIVSSIVSLFFGYFVEKFGIRKMIAFGLISLISYVMIFSFASQLPLFYLGGAFWGLGITFCGGTAASVMIRKWFDKDIGKYSGIVMSANGIGGAIAAQVITPLINDGTPFGYRNAYHLATVISIIITVIVICLLRDRADVNTSSTEKKPRGASWTGISYKEALKKPYFYFTFLLVLLTGISLQSIGSISTTHLQDLGFDPIFVGLTATVSSIVLTFSKVLVGVSYDKRGLRFTLLMCHIAKIISFIILACLNNNSTGRVLVFISTALSSIALPLETIVIPLLTGDLFGQTDYVKILGVFMAANTIGLCIGSPIGELFYTLFKTYVPAIWIFAGIMVVVSVSFQIVLNTVNKEKAAILAATKD